jgi:copper chaperone
VLNPTTQRPDGSGCCPCVIDWSNAMKFSVKNGIRPDGVPSIERAMKSVDIDAKVDVDLDAKTVSVDSWLMPEEFLVAFSDEEYEVRIVEA